jgi:alpha/beta superfamily hydrolase
MNAPSLPHSFPDAPATFLLPGPAGAIEMATATAEGEARTGTAIICHPHPLQGGTMQNKVVTTLERTLRELGLATVRFNFRGVGASAGSFDDGVGETDDLAAIAQWVRQVHPGDVLWLAGFSFGSYVAFRGARRLQAAQLIQIAPPASRWAFGEVEAPGCPWLVVQGESDEVVDPAAVYAWIDALPEPPQLIRMADTSHFFHRRLLELRDAVKSAVSANLPAPRQA